LKRDRRSLISVCRSCLSNPRNASKNVSLPNIIYFFCEKKLKPFLVAIGAQNHLLYYGLSKGELVQDFRSDPQPKDLSRVVISGSSQKFSVFYACGQTIKGVTKKGKEFFKLETSHTETIKSLHVAGQNLWSAGEYILNCYASVSNKILDRYFYICEDRINDMVVASVSGQLVQNPVVACQDKTVKVLVEGEDGTVAVLYQQKFDASVTCITLAQEQTHRFCPVLGYGLKNGGLGCIELTRDEPVLLWGLEGSQTNGSAAALVKACRLRPEEELHHFVVARDDGAVEVYAYEHKSPVPLLLFETRVDAAVTGLDVGFVTSAHKQEVLLCTYSGKVLALVPAEAAKQAGVDQARAKQDMLKAKTEKQEKISALQKEVEVLRKKVRELESLEESNQVEEEVKGSNGFQH